MRSNAVLFRGVPNVIAAYDRVDVPAWSLANGKDILFSYSGDDQSEGHQLLQQALDMLAENESQAILHLRIYDGLQGRITRATADTNAFPFALFDPEDGMVQMPKKKSELLARIAALEKKLEGEEEKPKGLMGKLGAIIESPEVQSMLIQTVIGAVKKFMGQGTTQAAAMGAIEQPQGATPAGASAWEALPVSEREKLQQAMEILMKRDPLIGTHLLALANKSADTYAMALKFL